MQCIRWHRVAAVEPGKAAVKRIVAEEKLDVLRQVHRKVRRIDVAKAGVQVLDPRRPPLDANVSEVDATAGLEHRAPIAWDDNSDRIVHDRTQP